MTAWVMLTCSRFIFSKAFVALHYPSSVLSSLLIFPLLNQKKINAGANVFFSLCAGNWPLSLFSFFSSLSVSPLSGEEAEKAGPAFVKFSAGITALSVCATSHTCSTCAGTGLGSASCNTDLPRKDYLFFF